MGSNMIGRYEILGELGRWAMGSVLRARDSIMRRVVAIKSIMPSRWLANRLQNFASAFIARLEPQEHSRIQALRLCSRWARTTTRLIWSWNWCRDAPWMRR